MLSQDGSESGLGADLRSLLCSRPKVAAAGRVEAQRRARATMMTAGLGLWAAITIAVAGPATSPEYLPVHLAHAAGAPPLLLFGLTAAPPVAIVVAPSHRTSIRSLADLRGQPVGLPGAGTPEHAMLTSVLTHAGVRIQEVPVHSYGHLRLAGALEQGQVAAAVLGDPWITRLAGEGGGVLADLRNRAEARRWLGAETVHAAVFVRADSTLG